MTRGTNRDAFLSAVVSVMGKDNKTITRAEIIDVCAKTGVKWPAWLVSDPAYRIGRGEYALSLDGVTAAPRATAVRQPRPRVERTVEVPALPVVSTSPSVEDSVAALHNTSQTHVLNLVPAKAQGYVPFGNFNDIRAIVKSKRFYPIYITGLSGNGKTMMVEQIHAQENREVIRVNVTIETDEDDLLGGFRLIDGRTVWQNGPVVIAMERGATLLLDEVDLGSNKMMCLQPVLEGKQIFLKKINKIVAPAPGFNVIATANTKGKGSDDGRFIGTNVQNEAMLDRYAITIEQEYPAMKVEAKILNNVLQYAGVDEPDFVERLVMWADVIRKTFADGGVNEVISTRRLVNICDAYVIFRDRAKAINLCLNRFDVDTKTSFMELYTKLDASLTPDTNPAEIIPDPDAEVEF
jgi:hypothetical protein